MSRPTTQVGQFLWDYSLSDYNGYLGDAIGRYLEANGNTLNSPVEVTGVHEHFGMLEAMYGYDGRNDRPCRGEIYFRARLVTKRDVMEDLQFSCDGETWEWPPAREL